MLWGFGVFKTAGFVLRELYHKSYSPLLMKCRAFHRDTFGMGFHQVIARNVECCSEGIQTGDHNETFHRIGIGVSNTDSGYPPQPPLPHRAETPPMDSTI